MISAGQREYAMERCGASAVVDGGDVWSEDWRAGGRMPDLPILHGAFTEGLKEATSTGRASISVAMFHMARRTWIRQFRPLPSS